MRRIRRGSAHQGNRAQCQSLGAFDPEPGGACFQPPPQDAAIVSENSEQRIVSREVVAHLLGTVQSKRRALAQHQETGRVVDLAVGKHHPDDARVAQRACGLQVGKRPHLCQDVGRSIDQNPVHVVARDGDGRLGPRPRPYAAVPNAVAVRAIAVPLRKAATRGGTQDMYPHGAQARADVASAVRTGECRRIPPGWPGPAWPAAVTSAGQDVHRDFESEANIQELGFRPGHRSLQG